MKMITTEIKGVYLIDLERKEDDRGFLARTFDRDVFAENGLDFVPQEGYITKSSKKGTIRGFHFLKVPEKKLTRVTKGAVYEVVVDIRPASETFGEWQGFTLKDTDYKMLYMEPGIAHAILALEDGTELASQYSPAYAPGNESGIRFDDPSLNIKWPIKVEHISEKDKNWPDFPFGGGK